MPDRNGYIGRAPSDSAITVARQVYNITSSTTSFTFTAGYDVGYMDAYLNGTRLINLTDYQATDGSTVDLTVAAVNGDVLELVAYKKFNLTQVTTSAVEDFNVGNNLTVTGSISGGGQDLTGIVTTLTAGENISLSGSTGAVTITGLAKTDVIVSERILVTGVTTSSGGFVGNLTGNVTGNTSGTAGGLTGTPNITVGSVNATSAAFSGDVSIGGTLTYEDVTNVDSVGLITARNGVIVSGSGIGLSVTEGGVRVTGVVTATSFSGNGANLTNLNIPASFNELDAALFS